MNSIGSDALLRVFQQTLHFELSHGGLMLYYFAGRYFIYQPVSGKQEATKRI